MTHETRVKIVWAVVFVTVLTWWLFQSPLSPEAAMARIPDSELVASKTVNGAKIWLRTDSNGDIWANVTYRPWLAWHIAGNTPVRRSLPGGILYGFNTFENRIYDRVNIEAVGIFVYVPDPTTVAALNLGGRLVELDEQNYFIAVLPPGTQMHAEDIVVIGSDGEPLTEEAEYDSQDSAKVLAPITAGYFSFIMCFH